jgi:tetratricopeptide (TPR) repeat protein
MAAPAVAEAATEEHANTPPAGEPTSLAPAEAEGATSEDNGGSGDGGEQIAADEERVVKPAEVLVPEEASRPATIISTASRGGTNSRDGPLKQASALAKQGSHEAALQEIDGYLAPFGKQPVSVDAVQAAAVSVRLCNELALACMRDVTSTEQLDAAYAYLKWALKAPHATAALRAVTLNNAGIYYARTSQPQAALRCLERVGRQGGIVAEDDVSVHVRLNMTTVLADLGRHAEALETAQEAVRTLTRAEREGKQLDASLLSAAYHNLAVQQERLGSSKGHVRSYRSAVLQARKGGSRSQMASYMEQAYTHARQRATSQPNAAQSGKLPPLSAGSKGGHAASHRHGVSSSFAAAGKTPSPGKRAHSGRGRPRYPSAAGGTYVSLDEVYSGMVPAAAVPVSPNSPALVPLPGAQQQPVRSPRQPRHAPRSAGTARIGA